MANSKANRSVRVPQPGKLLMYQTQCSANLALENVILNCQQLQTLNIIPRGFLKLYADMAEELRALLNSKITDTMHHIEMRDAKFFQDARLKWDSRPYPKAREPRQKPRK